MAKRKKSSNDTKIQTVNRFSISESEVLQRFFGCELRDLLDFSAEGDGGRRRRLKWRAYKGASRVPNESRFFGVYKAVGYTWRYDLFPRKLTNGISAFLIALNVKETHRLHALLFSTLCVWVIQRRGVPYAPLQF